MVRYSRARVHRDGSVDIMLCRASSTKQSTAFPAPKQFWKAKSGKDETVMSHHVISHRSDDAKSENIDYDNDSFKENLQFNQAISFENVKSKVQSSPLVEKVNSESEDQIFKRADMALSSSAKIMTNDDLNDVNTMNLNQQYLNVPLTPRSDLKSHNDDSYQPSETSKLKTDMLESYDSIQKFGESSSKPVDDPNKFSLFEGSLKSKIASKFKYATPLQSTRKESFSSNGDLKLENLQDGFDELSKKAENLKSTIKSLNRWSPDFKLQSNVETASNNSNENVSTAIKSETIRRDKLKFSSAFDTSHLLTSSKPYEPSTIESEAEHGDKPTFSSTFDTSRPLTSSKQYESSATIKSEVTKHGDKCKLTSKLNLDSEPNSPISQEDRPTEYTSAYTMLLEKANHNRNLKFFLSHIKSNSSLREGLKATINKTQKHCKSARFNTVYDTAHARRCSVAALLGDVNATIMASRQGELNRKAIGISDSQFKSHVEKNNEIQVVLRLINTQKQIINELQSKIQSMVDKACSQFKLLEAHHKYIVHENTITDKSTEQVSTERSIRNITDLLERNLETGKDDDVLYTARRLLNRLEKLEVLLENNSKRMLKIIKKQNSELHRLS